MERNTTAATAGQGLTLSSGGAIAGTAALAGGDLNLKSGISTGTGTSAIRLFTATASSGTTDNTPTEKLTILGSGAVGIGDITPDQTLDVHGAINGRDNFYLNDTSVIFVSNDYKHLQQFGNDLYANLQIRNHGVSVLQAEDDTTDVTAIGKINFSAPKYTFDALPLSDTSKYQVVYNPATGEVKAQKEPGHFFASYSNNTGFAMEFTVDGTYYPLVGALTNTDSHYFTIDNDTCKVTYTGPAGHIKFEVNISSPDLTDVIEYQLYNVTDGTEVPVSQLANASNVSLVCYDVNASTNDVYLLRAKDISNTVTITVIRIAWFGEVDHY
jgi:hypothetical protein